MKKTNAKANNNAKNKATHGAQNNKNAGKCTKDCD